MLSKKLPEIDFSATLILDYHINFVYFHLILYTSTVGFLDMTLSFESCNERLLQ